MTTRWQRRESLGAWCFSSDEPHHVTSAAALAADGFPADGSPADGFPVGASTADASTADAKPVAVLAVATADEQRVVEPAAGLPTEAGAVAEGGSSSRIAARTTAVHC